MSIEHFDSKSEQSRVDTMSTASGYVTPSQIEVAQFVPPPELAPFVTQFYHFRCNQRRVRDAQPAALGHMVFYLQGKGTLRFEDGQTYWNDPVSLFGPGMAHAEFDIEGPFEDFGLAMSPLGFVALTGKPATALADRMVDAADLFGTGITEMAVRFREERKHGRITVRDMVEQTTAFLLPSLSGTSPPIISN
ncbi:MAG: hypothetical protein IPH79_11035 [Sphingomonadales bacterium]|nr:hypothetical protein [Sphingomonadales bacterium]